MALKGVESTMEALGGVVGELWINEKSSPCAKQELLFVMPESVSFRACGREGASSGLI